MSGRIYLLDEAAGLTAMEEAAYESEKLLQELLAKYPDLLAGEQIDIETPRRWLLVTREMRVPDEQEGRRRWSLDHLFLDQDAVPTLVEVKRSGDTRLRREVVGQMLDYAANAVVYWPVEEIKAKFEARCAAEDQNPEKSLSDFLHGDAAAEEFWQRVKTNLQAGRIRMVFVADVIPAELRRVVEFLNEQMDPAEVLAVEVRQYIGKGVKTLVPRVVGQTEIARTKKSAGGPATSWTEETFLAALRQTSGEAASCVAKDLLDWVRPQVTEVWFGRGTRQGGVVPVIDKDGQDYHLFRMTTDGWFIVPFEWLHEKPPFDDEQVRRQLLAMINEISGLTFDDDVLTKRARIPFERLLDRAAVEKLKSMIGWMVRQIEVEDDGRVVRQQVSHPAERQNAIEV